MCNYTFNSLIFEVGLRPFIWAWICLLEHLIVFIINYFVYIFFFFKAEQELKDTFEAIWLPSQSRFCTIFFQSFTDFSYPYLVL